MRSYFEYESTQNTTGLRAHFRLQTHRLQLNIALIAPPQNQSTHPAVCSLQAGGRV